MAVSSPCLHTVLCTRTRPQSAVTVGKWPLESTLRLRKWARHCKLQPGRMEQVPYFFPHLSSDPLSMTIGKIQQKTQGRGPGWFCSSRPVLQGIEQAGEGWLWGGQGTISSTFYLRRVTLRSEWAREELCIRTLYDVFSNCKCPLKPGSGNAFLSLDYKNVMGKSQW